MTKKIPRKRAGGPWFGDDHTRALLERTARQKFPSLRRRMIEYKDNPYVEYTIEIDIPDYGPHETRILFARNLSEVGEPTVFSEVPFESPHRHRPANSLCMWHKDDPATHRWVPSEGIVGLMDYVWRHLYREHHWHENNHEWLGPQHLHEPEDGSEPKEQS